MNDFRRPGFRLSGSPIETRIAYTGFLVFVFVGYCTFAVLAAARIGPGYGDIVRHYRGAPGEETYPRAFGQMIEEMHFHAFIEGLVLLVLSHLFGATGVRPPWRVAVPVAAFGATFLDLACPWLVRYLAAPFAALQIACWLALGATALVLIAVPLHEMWLRRAANAEPAGEGLR